MAQPASTPAGARPLGKPRGWVVVFLLTLVTLGIYGLVWQYKTFQEMQDYIGDGIGGVVRLVLAVFPRFLNWFPMPAPVGNLYAAGGEEKPGSGITRPSHL